MSRTYKQLKCGCMVSIDGGGGLIPCCYDNENPDCVIDDYYTGVHAGCDCMAERIEEIIYYEEERRATPNDILKLIKEEIR